MRTGDIVIHKITGARGVIIDTVPFSPARVQWPTGRIYKHGRDELRATGERDSTIDFLQKHGY